MYIFRYTRGDLKIDTLQYSLPETCETPLTLAYVYTRHDLSSSKRGMSGFEKRHEKHHDSNSGISYRLNNRIDTMLLDRSRALIVWASEYG